MARFASNSGASTSAAAASAASFLPGASSDSSPLPAAFRAAAPTPTSSSTPTPSSSSTSAPFNIRSSQTNPVPRPTRGLRRPVHKYRLSVYSTRNNTILTLTTKIGTTSTSSSSLGSSNNYEDSSIQAIAEAAMTTDSVVGWVSAGSAGYKGASRGTYDAAVEVSIKMFNKIRQLVDPVNAPDAGMRKKNAWPQPTDIEVVWNGFGQGREAVFRTLMAGDGDGVRELVHRVTDATPLKVGGTRPKKRRVI
ncbi:BQ2448_2130 [Microbotryum intermedium]|uniref:BQ2448_2130 protein n=1 Tax=Microbotryum intermedium TaxID=269621 RepID=A0A238F5C5_9BASI|nr:BQ2448_2130 [Microbotryum intermedium]